MKSTNTSFKVNDIENIEYQNIPMGKVALGIDITPNKIYLLALEKISAQNSVIDVKCRANAMVESKAIDHKPDIQFHSRKVDLEKNDSNTKQFKLIYSAYVDLPNDVINGHEFVDLNYLSSALKTIWPDKKTKWGLKGFNQPFTHTVVGVCPSLIHTFRANENDLIDLTKQKNNAKSDVDKNKNIDLAVARAIENQCGINSADLAIDWHLNEKTGEIALAYVEKHHIANRVKLMQEANLPLTTITDTRIATALACEVLFWSLNSSKSNLNNPPPNYDNHLQNHNTHTAQVNSKHINYNHTSHHHKLYPFLDDDDNTFHYLAFSIWINAINGQSWAYSARSDTDQQSKKIIALSELLPVTNNDTNCIYKTLIESISPFPNSIIIAAGENINVNEKEKEKKEANESLFLSSDLFSKTKEIVSEKNNCSNINDCKTNYNFDKTDELNLNNKLRTSYNSLSNYSQIINKKNQFEKANRLRVNEEKNFSIHAKSLSDKLKSLNNNSNNMNEINGINQTIKESYLVNDNQLNDKQLKNIIPWCLPNICSSDSGQLNASWATAFGLAMTGLMQ